MIPVHPVVALPVYPALHVQLRVVEGGGKSMQSALAPHALVAHAFKSVQVQVRKRQTNAKKKQQKKKQKMG